MCDETKHRAGNHQSGASAVAKSDIAEYLQAEPAGLAVLRASEQRPLRLGLRPLRRRLRPALLPHGFAVGMTPLHSAFELFKLIDDVIGKLLDVREGVTARNQTKIELIQIADQRDVQRKPKPDGGNRINMEHLGAYTVLLLARTRHVGD
jgi:hypothetical protein